MRARALALALVALVVAVTACGSGGSSSSSTQPAATPGSVKGQTVTVAITPTMPYIGLSGGKLTGLDGDLFLKAADHIGVNVKAVAVDFPGLLAGVQSGRYDLGIGSIAWNGERAHAGIFTDPPYYSPVILAERPGVNAHTIADLEHKKLATVQSFFYIPALKKVPNAKLQTYPNFQAVLQDLTAGRVDVAFLDPLTVVYTKKKNPGLKYTTAALEPPTAAQLAAHPEFAAFQPSMTGWYLNSKQKALRDALTKEIRALYADGFAASAVKKWGGDPATMLEPIPYFTSERTKVDRPNGWEPPAP